MAHAVQKNGSVENMHTRDVLVPGGGLHSRRMNVPKTGVPKRAGVGGFEVGLICPMLARSGVQVVLSSFQGGRGQNAVVAIDGAVLTVGMKNHRVPFSRSSGTSKALLISKGLVLP